MTKDEFIAAVHPTGEIGSDGAVQWEPHPQIDAIIIQLAVLIKHKGISMKEETPALIYGAPAITGPEMEGLQAIGGDLEELKKQRVQEMGEKMYVEAAKAFPLGLDNVEVALPEVINGIDSITGKTVH